VPTRLVHIRQCLVEAHAAAKTEVQPFCIRHGQVGVNDGEARGLVPGQGSLNLHEQVEYVVALQFARHPQSLQHRLYLSDHIVLGLQLKAAVLHMCPQRHGGCDVEAAQADEGRVNGIQHARGLTDMPLRHGLAAKAGHHVLREGEPGGHQLLAGRYLLFRGGALLHVLQQRIVSGLKTHVDANQSGGPYLLQLFERLVCRGVRPAVGGDSGEPRKDLVEVTQYAHQVGSPHDQRIGVLQKDGFPTAVEEEGDVAQAGVVVRLAQQRRSRHAHVAVVAHLVRRVHDPVTHRAGGIDLTLYLFHGAKREGGVLIAVAEEALVPRAVPCRTYQQRVGFTGRTNRAEFKTRGTVCRVVTLVHSQHCSHAASV